MNPIFSRQRLSPFPCHSKEQGFTLIELLVVVIIIGILAAIAIPNTMSQIGKAREGEAKSLIGALNRAQQAYYFENRAFAAASEPKIDLDIPIGKLKYYDKLEIVPNVGIQYIHNDENDANNTRDYIGALQYNKNERSFSTIVCRMNKGIDVDSSSAAQSHVSSYGEVDTVVGPLACGVNATELR
jgi:prepilin-type N-terminal cleavage/methylation domain-containing protein